MSQPRVQFPVLQWIVVEAIPGVVLGVTREVDRLVRLARIDRRKAILSAREERAWLRGVVKRMASAGEAQRLPAALRSTDRDLADLWAEEEALSAEEVRAAREIALLHARLRPKYERGASRPWEPVAADQPEPREPIVLRCVPLPRKSLPPGERWYAGGAGTLRERPGPRPR